MIQYPRKGMRRPVRGLRRCQVCYAASASAEIDIEVNEFRGDDEVLRVCDNCQRLTARLMLMEHAHLKAEAR